MLYDIFELNIYPSKIRVHKIELNCSWVQRVYYYTDTWMRQQQIKVRETNMAILASIYQPATEA